MGYDPGVQAKPSKAELDWKQGRVLIGPTEVRS